MSRKRRLFQSDDQQLSIIPGSNVVFFSPQPRKVARQFELHFSAADTHFLTRYGPTAPPTPPVPDQPQVQDDEEAKKVLDECTQTMEELARELEEFEHAMDCA